MAGDVQPPIGIQERMSISRWSGLRTELIWIYNGHVAPETRNITAEHSTGFWVWLLKEGSVVVKKPGQTWSAKTGQWLMMPSGRAVQSFSANAKILSVHFLCQWPTGENYYDTTLARVWDGANYPALERSALKLHALVARQFPHVRTDFSQQITTYETFMLFQKYFSEWLSHFSRAWTRIDGPLTRSNHTDDRLLRALQILNQTPLSDPFPQASLLAQSGLGRSQLDRLALRDTGVTIREYWECLREQAACHSLSMGSMPVKEIAYQLGFKQPSHFTKWLARRTGDTPQIFRQNNAHYQVGSFNDDIASKPETTRR